MARCDSGSGLAEPFLKFEGEADKWPWSIRFWYGVYPSGNGKTSSIS